MSFLPYFGKHYGKDTEIMGFFNSSHSQIFTKFKFYQGGMGWWEKSTKDISSYLPQTVGTAEIQERACLVIPKTYLIKNINTLTENFKLSGMFSNLNFHVFLLLHFSSIVTERN